MTQNGKPTLILSKPAVTTRLAGLQCLYWSQSPYMVGWKVNLAFQLSWSALNPCCPWCDNPHG